MTRDIAYIAHGIKCYGSGPPPPYKPNHILYYRADVAAKSLIYCAAHHGLTSCTRVRHSEGHQCEPAHAAPHASALLTADGTNTHIAQIALNMVTIERLRCDAVAFIAVTLTGTGAGLVMDTAALFAAGLSVVTLTGVSPRSN